MAQPHEVLGVAANADEATINAAFRRAAKKFHPDLNNGDASGIQRLRRLIAARDFLANRRWRSSCGPKVRYRLPSIRKAGIGKSTVFAFVLAGTCSLLLLAALVPYPAGNPPKVSVVAKTSSTARVAAVPVSPVDTEIPDAGSADIKAIRDFREEPGYSPAEGAKRQASSPAADIRNAMKRAGALMSKTIRRIASEL